MTGFDIPYTVKVTLSETPSHDKHAITYYKCIVQTYVCINLLSVPTHERRACISAFIKKTMDVFPYFEEKSKRSASDASGKSINWYLQKEKSRAMFLHKMTVLKKF